VDTQTRKAKMALTKRTFVDKIEVVGSCNLVQVRTVTIIDEDGVELSKTYHRHTVRPGDDYTNETELVKSICQSAHTPDIVEAYQNELKAME
jgi:hypothetical protein